MAFSVEAKDRCLNGVQVDGESHPSHLAQQAANRQEGCGELI